MVLTLIWRKTRNRMTGSFLGSKFKAALGAVVVLTLAGVSWVSAQQVGTPAPVTPPAATPAAMPASASAPAPVATAAAGKAVASAKSGNKTAAHTLDSLLWRDLSGPQQLALEPLALEWDKMEAIRKQKWLDIAKRFSTMKPDEQQRVHERMRDWVKLTPDQRRQVRENYTRTKKIGASEKSVQWEQYQQLPEEQKKKLAAEAAIKKQVANLPSTTQSKVKPVAPIKAGASAKAAAAHPPAPIQAPPSAAVVTAPLATPAPPTALPTTITPASAAVTPSNVK